MAKDNFLDEIQEICKLEVYQLSPMQIGFLRARKSYLTPDQLNRFESVLEDRTEDIGLSYGELKSRAKDLGIKVGVGIKKVDLKKMVDDKEKELEDAKIDEELKSK